MEITGLCTDGPRGAMLWLRDGTALVIETSIALSNYYDFVVNVTGSVSATSIALEAISLADESADSFLKTEDI